MIERKDHQRIAKELQSLLADRFDVVSVRIGDDIHYRGTNVVVTTPAFSGLLPEQRFHHIVHAVPPDFYEAYLRGGVVWFELSPGETGLQYMRMPRSDDVAPDAAGLDTRLRETRFLERFEQVLRANTGDPSQHDFVVARRTLAEAGWTEPEITRARLLFILRGAFSDADILPVLAAAPDEPDGSET